MDLLKHRAASSAALNLAQPHNRGSTPKIYLSQSYDLLPHPPCGTLRRTDPVLLPFFFPARIANIYTR